MGRITRPFSPIMTHLILFMDAHINAYTYVGVDLSNCHRLPLVSSSMRPQMRAGLVSIVICVFDYNLNLFFWNKELENTPSITRLDAMWEVDLRLKSGAIYWNKAGSSCCFGRKVGP